MTTTNEEILITVKLKDMASSGFDKIKNSSSNMKIGVGAAMSAVGAATLSYAKTAVDSAITAESEWNRFGGSVNAVGGNWEANTDKVKKWVSEYSNSMGYAVSDTRSAMTTMMNYGLSLNETEDAMKAVTGIAAAMGKSQEEASSMLIKGFAGQGRGLKQLGINLEDYKDKATGAIDRQKLLQDIVAKTDDTVAKHADSTEAQMTRVNNSLKSLKTDFGKALLSAIEPLIPVVQQFIGFINQLPAPVKTAGFAFFGLVAGVTAIAGPITSAIGLLQKIGVSFDGIKDKIKSAGEAFRDFGNKTTETVSKTTPDVDIDTKGQKGGKGTDIDIDVPGKGKSGGTGNAKWDEYVGDLDKEKQGLDKVEKKTKEVGDKAKRVGDETKKTTKSKRDMDKLKDIGKTVPKGVGAEATAGAAEAEAAAGGLSGLGASIGTMVVPILTITAVIAVVIACVTLLVAEALIFARLIAELIDALGFDKIDLKPAIEGIKQIGEAIWELARTMGSFTIASAVSIIANVFNAFGIGIESIKNAANDLKKAVPIINSFKDLPTIDEGVSAKLKSLADGLQGIADAAKGMNDAGVDVWFGGFTNFLVGGSLNKIEEAHDDLVKAVPLINSFSDLDDVEESAGEKLKKLGEALKNVSTAIKSLNDAGDVVFNNPPNISLAALETIKTTLMDAAKKINEFKQMDTVEEVGGKLIPLIDALKPIKAAVEALNEFQALSIPPAQVAVKVQEAKQRLRGVAVQIAEMQGLPPIEGVGPKIIPIIDALKPLTSAVEALNDFMKITVPPASVAARVQEAKQRLRGVAQQLMEIQGLPEIGNVAGKLNRITTALNPLKTAINSLKNFPQTQNNVADKVKKGVTAIKNIVRELNQLNGENVGNVSGILNAVNHALQQLNNALRHASVNVIGTSRSIGANIVNGIKFGMAPLSSTLVSVVESAMQAIQGPAANGGRSAGTAATDGFKFKLNFKDAASKEMDAAIQAIRNKTSQLVDAARSAASQASQAFESEGLGRASPGKMARATATEMSDVANAMIDARSTLIRHAQETGDAIVNSWKAPNLKIGFSVDDNVNLPKMMNDLKLNDKTVRAVNSKNIDTTKPENGNTEIHIHEGAIKLDARNLTTKESKQVMINALEGLDVLKNTNIRGI